MTTFINDVKVDEPFFVPFVVTKVNKLNWKDFEQQKNKNKIMRL